MSKILVVDDEDKIRDIIRKYGEFEGYEIAEASNGMDAIAMTKKDSFDIIILDVMMPELDGFSTCAKIKENMDVPVIMLSARGEEYDRIHGFEVGVDDYVVKPFSPKELMMRVKAVLARCRTTDKDTVDNKPDMYIRDGLEVNFTARTVTVDGKRVEMSPKEYDLLNYLISNRGIALLREQLITEVWGYDYYGDDRTLDTHIKLLRTSLGPYRTLLTTLRGVGYRFEAD